MTRVRLIAAALLLARPENAAAEPAVREIALDPGADIVLRYDAPSECPAADDLIARVRERLAAEFPAALAELARRIEVSIAADGQRYVASVDFLNAQGERMTRSVSGSICSEVVEGVGLVTALAVRSRVAERAQSAASEAATASTPTAVQDAAPPPVAAPAFPPPRHSAAPSPTTARTKPVAGSATRARLRLGARGSVTTGVGPGLAWGPGAYAALAWQRARVGVAFGAFWSGDERVNAIPANFRLLAASAELCPTTFRIGRWSSFEPCAIGELGSFRAVAEVEPPAVVSSSPRAIAWGALGALGRWVLELPPFFAALELSGRAPLRRERFYVASKERVVFRIPAIAAGAGLALGLEF